MVHAIHCGAQCGGWGDGEGARLLEQTGSNEVLWGSDCRWGYCAPHGLCLWRHLLTLPALVAGGADFCACRGAFVDVVLVVGLIPACVALLTNRRRLKKNERKVEALRRRFADREAALLRGNPEALGGAAYGVPPVYRRRRSSPQVESSG